MMNQLKQDIETAAASGAIVANIQKEAMDSGVLTSELKTMPRQLSSEDINVQTKMKMKTINVQTLMSSHSNHTHHSTLEWWAILLIAGEFQQNA
jgi:hypothetical protein